MKLTAFDGDAPFQNDWSGVECSFIVIISRSTQVRRASISRSEKDPAENYLY